MYRVVCSLDFCVVNVIFVAQPATLSPINANDQNPAIRLLKGMALYLPILVSSPLCSLLNVCMDTGTHSLSRLTQGTLLPTGLSQPSFPLHLAALPSRLEAFLLTSVTLTIQLPSLPESWTSSLKSHLD